MRVPTDDTRGMNHTSQSDDGSKGLLLSHMVFVSLSNRHLHHHSSLIIHFRSSPPRQLSQPTCHTTQDASKALTSATKQSITTHSLARLRARIDSPQGTADKQESKCQSTNQTNKPLLLQSVRNILGATQ
jgi:hypothetical protein